MLGGNPLTHCPLAAYNHTVKCNAYSVVALTSLYQVCSKISIIRSWHIPYSSAMSCDLNLWDSKILMKTRMIAFIFAMKLFGFYKTFVSVTSTFTNLADCG